MIENIHLVANIDPQVFWNEVKEAIDEAQEKGLNVDVQYSTTTIVEDGELDIQYSALIIKREI